MSSIGQLSFFFLHGYNNSHNVILSYSMMDQQIESGNPLGFLGNGLETKLGFLLQQHSTLNHGKI